MLKRAQYAASLFVMALVVAASGCGFGPGETGSFDHTYTVSGPVQLELHNGSGYAQIRTGSTGQVHVRAEYTAWNSIFEDAEGQLKELNSSSPVEQQGNFVRVGFSSELLHNVRVNYTIEVPVDTELHAQVGSGDLEVTDIKGPATLHTGSGRITVRNIQNDASADSGSGSIALADVSGRASATTGSGTIELNRVGGEIHASTGSGRIEMDQVHGRVTARTGSGSIQVSGVSDDLRATSSSGSIHVQGNPAASSYWQIHTGSGSITLDVPSDAGFRVHAVTHSSSINSDLPLTIEEQGRHELRGRVGNGNGSVDLETGSGGIHIR